MATTTTRRTAAKRSSTSTASRSKSSTATGARKAGAARRTRASTTTSRSRANQNAATSSRSRASQDAIALLKKVHADVRQLFPRFRSFGPTATKSRRRVIDKMIRELSVHAAVEEQVLYPNLRRIRGGEQMSEH